MYFTYFFYLYLFLHPVPENRNPCNRPSKVCIFDRGEATTRQIKPIRPTYPSRG